MSGEAFQPIAAGGAPEDGTPVLVTDGSRIWIASQRIGRHAAPSRDGQPTTGRRFPSEATHWAPIPSLVKPVKKRPDLQWWLRPCDESRLADMIGGMEEAARWLDTETAYSGSNRSRWMAEAATAVRERIEMVRKGQP